ncbi:MAG: metallophosphoesterase [Fervidobacterium sp.]
MKISIFSDLHFGYGLGSKIENYSFDNANEAIEKILDSDLIIICGDIFDNRSPKSDVLAKAIKILSKPSLVSSDIKLVETLKKDMEKTSKTTLRGIPVIALHGTHERLGREQLNAVQVIESAGFLIHLHCNGLVFEKGDERVAIQGMSGVPERYAKQVLEKWNPRPVKGCYNILLLHQSIDPFIYSPQEPPTLTTSNLPEGFDLIVNGHIHTPRIEKVGKTTILLTGSTITTQLKKEEAENPKGIYKLHLPENKLKFVKLENARRFFYEEIRLSDDKLIKDQIKEKIDVIFKYNFSKPPIIRLKITGKNVDILDKELKKIEDEYSGKAIIKYSKHSEISKLEEKIDFLRKAREERISIDEMGMRLLNENLMKQNFSKNLDSSLLFNLLSEGDVDKAFEILTENQKTLKHMVADNEE